MDLRPQENRLTIQGQLQPGDYTLPGDVSSQFISGMLFALPLLEGESTLTVTGPREQGESLAQRLAGEIKEACPCLEK